MECCFVHNWKKPVDCNVQFALVSNVRAHGEKKLDGQARMSRQQKQLRQQNG